MPFKCGAEIAHSGGFLRVARAAVSFSASLSSYRVLMGLWAEPVAPENSRASDRRRSHPILSSAR